MTAIVITLGITHNPMWVRRLVEGDHGSERWSLGPGVGFGWRHRRRWCSGWGTSRRAILRPELARLLHPAPAERRRRRLRGHRRRQLHGLPPDPHYFDGDFDGIGGDWIFPGASRAGGDDRSRRLSHSVGRSGATLCGPAGDAGLCRGGPSGCGRGSVVVGAAKSDAMAIWPRRHP